MNPKIAPVDAIKTDSIPREINFEPGLVWLDLMETAQNVEST